MKRFGILVLSILSFSGLLAVESSAQEIDLYKYASRNKLVGNNTLHTFEDLDRKRGVSCKGIAWIKDMQFSKGVIDIDLRGKDMLQQSFLGIAFHGVDTMTYDAIYFRPFNFRSNNPESKIHAVQYISAPDNHWEKLRKEFNGVYEKGIESTPDPKLWFHARIEVGDSDVKVFVNGETTPSLSVKLLNDRKTGLIGLWSTNQGVYADFTNLKIKSSK